MENMTQEHRCDTIVQAILQELIVNRAFVINMQDGLPKAAKNYLSDELTGGYLHRLMLLGYAAEHCPPGSASPLHAFSQEGLDSFWTMYKKYEKQAAACPYLPEESLFSDLRSLLEPYITSFQEKIHEINTDPVIPTKAGIEASKIVAYENTLQEFDKQTQDPKTQRKIQFLKDPYYISPRKVLEKVLLTNFTEEDWMTSIAAVQKDVYMEQEGIKEEEWLPSYCNFLTDVSEADEAAAKKILSPIVEEGREAVLESWPTIVAIAEVSHKLTPQLQEAMKKFPVSLPPFYVALKEHRNELLSAIVKEVASNPTFNAALQTPSSSMESILHVATAYDSLVLGEARSSDYPFLQGILLLGLNPDNLAQTVNVSEVEDLAQSIRDILRDKNVPMVEEDGRILLRKESTVNRNTIPGLRFLENRRKKELEALESEHEENFNTILCTLRDNFLKAIVPRWGLFCECISKVSIQTPELQDILETLEVPHRRHQQRPHFFSVRAIPHHVESSQPVDVSPTTPTQPNL